MIAAQALEVAAVVLLTPVPEHMDREPALLVHPESQSSAHSSSPFPWRVIVGVDPTRVATRDIGVCQGERVREVGHVRFVAVLSVSQRGGGRVRGCSSERGAPGLLG